MAETSTWKISRSLESNLIGRSTKYSTEKLQIYDKIVQKVVVHFIAYFIS